MLLSAALALPSNSAAAQSTTQAATHSVAHSVPQSSAGQAPAKSAPRARSKAEFEAYRAASVQRDPAKLEVAATDFAEKYPASELRPFLFQRAMGLYEQADNPVKSLEMARAVLKYDPANAVALLGAAQMLADRTHDTDLDRDGRFEEASADARSALQYAGEIPQPSQLTAKEFAEATAQLRGAAHEVLGTVAYKKRDYRNAIKEYAEAAAEEKEHTAPVVWLRVAVAEEKSGEYEPGLAAAEKAIASSDAGSPVRELAAKEKARIEALKPASPQPSQSGASPAPALGGEAQKSF